MTHHTSAVPPEDEFEVEEETAEELAAEAAALPTALHPPAGLTEEEETDWWMKNVYCGDQMPQMTVRAFVAAAFIGALMSVSNLYVGLKSGWGLGVTITAAIIAFAIFKSLETFFRTRPLGMLENCTILSAASGSASMSSAGLVSAIPALYMCTGQPMGMWQMMAWLSCVAALGAFMAVPLKRQLINVDKLPFPTGTATAETLRSLHSTGAKAMRQAKTLLWCGLVGALVKFWVDAWPKIFAWTDDKWQWGKGLASWAPRPNFPLFWGDRSRHLFDRYAIGFEPSTIFIAAGALMGIRVGVSMLLGTIVFFGILGPTMDHIGVLHYDVGKSAFRTVVEWTLWPAVALMVTAGLTNFAMKWRMIARALGELTSIFGKRGKEEAAANVDVSMSWFAAGVALAGTGCVVLGVGIFGIHWWMGVLAVLLTFVLSIVAARAAGETDTTPIGAMGKITQLTFGIIDPGNLKTNLMTAAITSGSACYSADLLQSLKVGHLIGAHARKQAIAQLFGILVGAVVAVPVFFVIVRMPPFDPKAVQAAAAKPADTNAVGTGSPVAAKKVDLTKTNLMTDELAAPSVAVWKGVAEVLAKGVKNLPDYSLVGMTIGGILGIIIALLEQFVPRKYIKWIPSATGLGLAGVVMPQNSISMFLGALIGWYWMKKSPKSADDYMISGASGLIAGESLTGVGINLVTAAPGLIRSLFGG